MQKPEAPLPEAEEGSFVIEFDGTTFHYHISPLGVACSHSGGEDLFSLRRKDGIYLTGLTEVDAIQRLWEPSQDVC